MNDEYFLFEWFLSEEPEGKIEEKIPIAEYETFLSEHGTIAEDILSACALKNIEQNSSYLSFNAQMVFDTLSGDFVNALRESVSEYFSHEKLSKNNCITINFDILSKIAYAYVLSTCQNSSDDGDLKEGNDRIGRILNDIIITALTPDANSGQNGISPSPHRKPEDDGYDQIVQLIEAIRNSHNITKDYIKSDDDKCVALYKKWAGKELTVAFSGHRDCIDDNLYTFFGVLKQGNKKYRDYEKIAKAIGANLAGTTYSVSRYDFSHPDIRRDPITSIMHRSKTDDDYYSCCERKIFAYLDNRDAFVYSGKLFIKSVPCQECLVSIFHHVTLQGKLFSLFVGLPI